MGGASSLGATPEELAAVVTSASSLFTKEALVGPDLVSVRGPPRAAPGVPSASGVDSDDDTRVVPCNRFGVSALGTAAQVDDSEGAVDPVGADNVEASACGREAGVCGPEADVCGTGEGAG